MNKLQSLYIKVKAVSGFKFKGLVLVFLSVAFLELFNHYSAIKITNPAVVLAIPVIYTILAQGLKWGLVGALVQMLYLAVFYSDIDGVLSYTPEAMVRISVASASLLILTAMTGSFKQYYEKIIQEQSDREIKEATEQSSARFRTLVEQSPVSFQMFDPSGETLLVNKAWEKLWGVTFEELKKRQYNILSDPQLEAKGIAEYIRQGFAGKPAVIPPVRYNSGERFGSGRERWVRAFIYPLLDSLGKVKEVVLLQDDISEEYLAEEEVKKSKQQMEVVLGNIEDGITVQALNGQVIYANVAAARMVGFESVDSFLHSNLQEISSRFEMEDENGKLFPFENLPGRLVLQGKPAPEVIIRYRRKGSDAVKWSKVRATAVPDEKGRVFMAVNVFSDITEEKSAEQRRQRRLLRQEYLASAGEILASSLKYQETLKKIAEISVPKLADWCAVDMLSEDGMRLSRLAVAHQNPEKIKLAYELMEQYPPILGAPVGVGAVIRGGKSEFYPVITQDMVKSIARDPGHLELINKVGLASIIMVPLKILGKSVGVITFASAESGVHFSEEDLNTAEELARRASLAVQNARLFKQAQDTARREREKSTLLDTLLNSSPAGFAFINRDLEYVIISKSLAAMHKVRAQDFVGTKIGSINPVLADWVRPRLLEVLKTGQPLLNEELAGSVSGEDSVRNWLYNFYPVREEGAVKGVGMLITDITSAKAAQHEIHYRAHFDSLTGLPNRKSFEEALAASLVAREKLAVMFLDLDRFKQINDTLGHAVGDMVFREVAARLKGTLQEGDMVARWGGDEFVVLLRGISSSFDATRAASHILKVMEPVIRVQGHTLHVSASIGISLSPEHGTDPGKLQKYADSALYLAKSAGKNRAQLYQESLDTRTAESMELESELRRSIEQGELRLWFQPILELKSNKIQSVETLLRWQHPKLGLLKPGHFLKMAEETGFIVSIGEWVLKTVCKLNKQWQEHGVFLNTSINISGRQFSEESVVERILETVEQCGMDPKFLELEITESVAMENSSQTSAKLTRLKDYGISITVDDFGTGYSSLSYLKRFPIHKLKIDKSFVRHSITNEQDSSIIRAIISMAKSLHLKVIAEGVNSEQQVGFLKSLGCDAVQGYFVSPPLENEEFLNWLKKYEAAKVHSVPAQFYEKEHETAPVAPSSKAVEDAATAGENESV